MKKRPFALVVVVIAVAALGAGVGMGLRALLGDAHPPTGVVVRSGTPAIGGAFALTDHHGNPVTDADFQGRYMLVLFGYTFCPDVCPVALQNMALALDILGKTGQKVQPIFITIDPERDTVEVLAEYAPAFHPRLLALTGTPGQVAATAKVYRIFYAKAEGDPGAGVDEYLMDHSSIVYLMGPDGTYLRHFSHGTSPEAMAEGIAGSL